MENFKNDFSQSINVIQQDGVLGGKVSNQKNIENQVITTSTNKTLTSKQKEVISSMKGKYEQKYLLKKRENNQFDIPTSEGTRLREKERIFKDLLEDIIFDIIKKIIKSNNKKEIPIYKPKKKYIEPNPPKFGYKIKVNDVKSYQNLNCKICKKDIPAMRFVKHYLKCNGSTSVRSCRKRIISYADFLEEEEEDEELDLFIM